MIRLGNFGGGVVIEGSADQRRVTELAQADAVDIGTRGALTVTSGPSDYTTLVDMATVNLPITRLHGIVGSTNAAMAVVAEGEGTPIGTPAGDAYLVYPSVPRSGAGDPYSSCQPVVTAISVATGSGTLFAPIPEGIVVTGATFAGRFGFRRFIGGVTTLYSIYLVNLGAREGTTPRSAPGLHVIGVSSVSSPVPIGQWDALGTGLFTPDFAGPGTNGQQLYFRGIIPYNNHVFGWGFDSADTVDGEGPNRVMFCNLGDPTKWGNDNIAAEGTDRAYTDSDAIVLGDAGDLIRAAIVWNGRLWFGTNRGLHFIAGYGRESFLTNGATPVMRAYNVVGPGALIEGPDRLLYGVGDQGLWKFDGNGVPEACFEKLRDQSGFSEGYWDLLWTDDTEPLGAYPGATNRDLLWMATDHESQQVLVGIPWCDAETGYGPGTDTVVLKYHVRTEGFTRQVFSGVQYTAAGYFRAEGGEPDVRMLGTATAGEASLQRYAYKAALDTAPVLPDPLPELLFGPYALFGPEGRGVVTRCYITIQWDALPLVFACVVSVDDVAVATFTLTIGATAPVGPSEGDVWLDTAQSSTSIGNGTAATGIPAAGGYLAKVYNDGDWAAIPGMGGVGTRATVPVPLVRRMGTRLSLAMTTTSAAGRFTVEGLGFEPGAGVQAA